MGNLSGPKQQNQNKETNKTRLEKKNCWKKGDLNKLKNQLENVVLRLTHYNLKQALKRECRTY